MQCRWVYHNNKKQIVQFVWLLNAMVLLLLVCLYGCRCGFAVKKYSTTICAVVWIQTLISSSPANHSTTQLQYISSSRISFSFVLDSWDFSCPPSPRNSDLSGGFMVYPGKYKSNCRRSKCTYVHYDLFELQFIVMFERTFYSCHSLPTFLYVFLRSPRCAKGIYAKSLAMRFRTKKNHL